MTEASVVVFIVLTEEEPIQPNLDNLKEAFSDPYFVVEVISSKEPIPPTKKKKHQLALKQATQYPDLPAIVILDSSVTNVDPVGMRERISTVINQVEFDLCYLCKWLDACMKYQSVAGIGYIDGGSTLKWTVSPHGTQAILYSVYARNVVNGKVPMKNGKYFDQSIPLDQALNQAIMDDLFNAVTFVPNIVDFDINQVTDDNDYLKLNECDPNASDNGNGDGNPTGFIWFVFLIIIFVLVAYALIQVGTL